MTNNFVWFALTYWAYLETRSVITTSFVGGTFLVVTALSGFWFGSIVDHNKKKTVMLLSSFVTLMFFLAGYLFYLSTPEILFRSIANPQLWILVLILLSGVIMGNIRNIALSTLITILVPEENRDKANGLSGMMMGIAFAITSIGSGLVLGFFGMQVVLLLTLVLTVLSIGHLFFIEVPEKEIIHTNTENKKLDIKSTIKVVAAIPGLYALIFFTTFNNFLGGSFMSLMDAYGLTLVSVQTWGIIWGFLSLGFIFSGLFISKYGLGKNPLKTLFRANIIIWIVCIFFTIQPSIILLVLGCFIWICSFPFIEATEQTIIQKVVPLERQGRVFGFAQSIEQAASPLTAFLIGPIAQFIFIPFMTTGAGVELIGDWFGTGPGRGMALVFTSTGIIGFVVTLLSMNTKPYQLLTKKYLE